MFQKLMIAAALLLPSTAMAVTISPASQLDIAGSVNLNASSFTPTGHVDLIDPGFVIFATGDFAAIPAFTQVSLTDIDFTAPGVIWSVGGFTYTATAFTDITSSPTSVGFKSLGTITGPGFDPTEGQISYAANPLSGLSSVSFSMTTTTVVLPTPAGLLLMGTALAGLGLARRKPGHAAARP